MGDGTTFSLPGYDYNAAAYFISKNLIFREMNIAITTNLMASGLLLENQKIAMVLV